MAMIPLLVARIIIEGAGDEMGDIQFLAIKEFDGKLRKDEGELSVAGTLATLTAAGGKDMYLASAKISIRGDGSAAVGKVELQLDGVAIETWIGRVPSTNVGVFEYEFKNVGHKVTTGLAITLEVISETSLTIEGFIEGWEENTGGSPQIPPLEPV